MNALEGNNYQNSFKSNKIVFNRGFFCFKGFVDGKLCSFKIDTGSDVSILNSILVSSLRR